MQLALDPAKVQRKASQALEGLKANVRSLPHYDGPVLLEGGVYQGIWQECGPMESLTYGRFIEPEIAIHSHRIFFRLQKEDGQLPCWVWPDQVGYGQTQFVVPIARTALAAHALHPAPGFLEEAYSSCRRWDEWLARHRNTMKRGLCEAFCEYDTGHDNSPRFAGLPKDCLNRDGRLCPAVGRLPYGAPDLTASVCDGRLALAEMAEALGLPGEADAWRAAAAETKAALMDWCFDKETACFYDVNRDGEWVRIVGDAMVRVLGSCVLTPKEFEAVFERHIINPDAFWTPFPLPSISASDPQFVRDLPPNSWAGAGQCLAALRAPRWLEAYGKQAELKHLMERWLIALTHSDGFHQQLNPWTGEMSHSHPYSPAMCVTLEFAEQLELLG